MRRRGWLRPGGLLRKGAVTVIAALVATFLVAGQPAGSAEQAVAAEAAEPTAPVAEFAAGSIITDPLFYDFGTMSAADIQEFLDDKVPECSLSSEAPCLRDYLVDTSDIDSIRGKCDNDIRGARNQTAAQVIYAVAIACEVNPQVLLVTLQKEQGLVTADSVATLKYRKAMGYGCPDTAECDAKYYGFFRQVYWAARSFNAYFSTPAAFRFQPGETASVAYSPKAGCGHARIALLNRATAALYNYTPYTPDEASLANPFEEGGECSSYGNRNFWLYFNSWFGDSSLGQYLVTNRGSTWLVAGEERWKLAAGTPQLGSAMRGLGLRGEVSTAYLESRIDRGHLTPIVQIEGNSNRYYLLGDGKKHVLQGCGRVEGLGFSCDVPVFRQSALASYKRSTELQWASTITVRSTDGSRFQLGPNGARSEIIGDALADDPQADIPVDTPVLASIPVANPAARPGSLLVDPLSGDGYYLPTAGTRTLRIDRSFVVSSDAPAWFGGSDGGIDGEVSAASVAVLPALTDLPAFFQVDGRSWMLGAAGRIPLAAPDEWAEAFPALDADFAALIPVDPDFATMPLAVPATISPTNGESQYRVSGGVRAPVDTTAGPVIHVPGKTLLAIPLAP